MGRTKEDLVMELEELKGEERLYEIGWLVSDDDDHIYRVLSSFKARSFKEACYRIVALMKYGARSLDEALTVLGKDDSTSIITGKPLSGLTTEDLLEELLYRDHIGDKYFHLTSESVTSYTFKFWKFN